MFQSGIKIERWLKESVRLRVGVCKIIKKKYSSQIVSLPEKKKKKKCDWIKVLSNKRIEKLSLPFTPSLISNRSESMWSKHPFYRLSKFKLNTWGGTFVLMQEEIESELHTALQELGISVVNKFTSKIMIKDFKAGTLPKWTRSSTSRQEAWMAFCSK